jgi:1,2-diacylglycerol 3-alpha-glucosyltransferase
MRILFVSDTYYPHLNGVYYFVCRIAPLLQQRGHSVAVIVPSETTAFTRRKIDNIDVYGVPSLPVALYPKIRLPIPFLLRSPIDRVLNDFAPDVIHIQDHFPLARAVIKRSKRSGIPNIGTNHFMPENLTAMIRTASWRRRLEKLLWSRFSSVYNQLMLVTTPTETAARLIRPRLQVEVMAVSSGIDLKKFTPSGDNEKIRARYGIPNKPAFLFVGRLDPEKKIEELLEAMALAREQADFCLVVVGKGIRKKPLEKLAETLGIAGDVIFTGFIPEEDLPMIYHLSRCFIIASTAELLSLATLQAMACGLPVIAVRAGALGELVRDRVNGLLFDTGDIHGIVRCMLEIIGNQALGEQMGEKSLEFSLEHDIHKTVRSFERIYDYLAQKEFWEVVNENGPWILSSEKK